MGPDWRSNLISPELANQVNNPGCIPILPSYKEEPQHCMRRERCSTVWADTVAWQ